MKKFLLILSLLFIYSCSSSNNTTEENNSLFTLEPFSNNYYSIDIPNKWVLIDEKSDSLPKPKSWEITLALKSNELKYWFSNNILILTQELTKNIEQKEYSMINNIWSSKDYLEYIKLDSFDINFKDTTPWFIYIFEAKYNSKTPKFKYIQSAKICQNKAHLITIALSIDTKKTTDYENIIKSMTCETIKK